MYMFALCTVCNMMQRPGVVIEELQIGHYRVGQSYIVSRLRRKPAQYSLTQTINVHITGGVKNATLRYDLPPPPLAVRNLVRCTPP